MSPVIDQLFCIARRVKDSVLFIVMNIFNGFIILAGMAVLSSTPALAEFHGYRCTKDCSGHKAGYAWAERKAVQDARDCTARSRSFREGCLAWVEDGKEEQPDPKKDYPDRRTLALSVDRD
ncbi:hypothetical protein [Hyphomicrobium sp. NDB2Meth4]|uniref:hypothetical protein n=1 Tax=Hyphomicrobium sp. NDB2Meth4 TaxID=1892846 RepID=UPI001AECB872|nr:hypothetical protein [Hyphomicrobium sp. NDB2Meth4]